MSKKYGVSMDIKLGVTPGAKLEAAFGANKNLKRDTILDANGTKHCM